MTTPSDPKTQSRAKPSGNYISRRLNPTDILQHARKTWNGQEQTAKCIALETERIISETYGKMPAFFGSKSKKWILGGLFYLLGQRYGEPKTQKQIARSLGTNEMTIRASYRDWLTRFPELWKKPQTNNNHSAHSEPNRKV